MEQAKYKAEDIANYYISRSNKEFIDKNGVAEGITNLKLQKMLYFAQVAHLSVYEKPLFDEEIVAWQFGPVIQEIYNKYKEYKNQPIDPSGANFELDADIIKFLENVWDIYGKYSASELVQMTHSHQPWKEKFNGPDDDKVITKDRIIEYYKGYYQSDDGEA